MGAEAVLKEIESLSEKECLPIIGPVRGKYLVETIREFKVKTVLEIGTLVGYSAILIARNLAEDGRVVAIEINPASAERARRNIERAGLSGKIQVRAGDARDVIPALSGEFDLVFLDAAKGEYLAYLKLAEKKMRQDGVVFADNVKMFARDMRDYLDYVRDSGKYRSQYIDAGDDGVEVSVRLS